MRLRNPCDAAGSLSTELVIYPREPHGLREPAHLLDFMRRIIGWFDEHVKAAVPATM